MMYLPVKQLFPTPPVIEKPTPYGTHQSFSQGTSLHIDFFFFFFLSLSCQKKERKKKGWKSKKGDIENAA